MRRYLVATLLTLGVLGAVAVGAGLVRASLVTDYVGVDPDYVLEGPDNVACSVPPDTDRTITVTWQDQDAQESGFIVTRQGPLVNGTSTSQFQLPAASGSGGTVAFTDTSVVPDASYTYTVRSFLGPALSPAASASDGCTTQSVPPQPTEVVAEAIGEHAIRISWLNNASNQEGFKVYRYSTEDGRPGVEAILLAPADAESYPDNGAELAAPGLLSQTEYCYYVMAYNSRGPDAPPPGDDLACAVTWSEPPRVVNLQVGEGARPTITWEFQDDDPPDGGDPQQTKVQVQVCASEFLNDGDQDYDDDCPGQSWRWNASSTFAAQSLQYLQWYPRTGVPHEHPLDFSVSQRYYLRLRAWDDTGTPSAWATPTGGSFTVPPPSGALVNDLSSAEGLTLSGGASLADTYGGEVGMPVSGARVSGLLGSLVNVVSVRLLESATPGISWEVRRPGDSSWVAVPGNGATGASWDDPANGLEWRATMGGNYSSGVLGSVALAVNANHAPTVTQCRAVRLIGGVGEDFAFTVTVSDPDSDFDYSLTQVQFDWDGGTGPNGWQSFGAGGPLTEFTAAWAFEGNFTPTVQARDQYGATSAVEPCDTVLVGSATPAWLRTQDADVFSGGTIYGRSPANQANATYLVQASGEIQEFSTEGRNCRRDADGTACDPTTVATSSYRQIPLPQPNGGQPLGTVLGSVDIGGILSGRYSNGSVQEFTGSHTNLSSFFGSLLASPLAPEARVLNGAIVHVQGNATVDATTTIGNAGDGQSGAGLIVIDGDLFINAPIAYDVNPVQVSLRRLASLGWLVKGNVYISPAVWAVDAATPASACSGIDQFEDCRPAVVGTFYLYDGSGGDGVFFTGSGGSLDDLPLQLGGLVVAQRFALQRGRPDDLVPAELFRYDGRVFANPPPGLQDFAKALPRWRPLAPQP